MTKLSERINRIKTRCKQDKDYFDDVLAWLLLGVFPSLFPIFFRLIILVIVGIKIKWSGVVSDFVLVVFSICVNSISLMISEKKSNKDLRLLAPMFVEVFMMIVLFSLYSFDLRLEDYDYMTVLRFLFALISFSFLLITTFIGLFLLGGSKNEENPTLRDCAMDDEE